MKALLLVGIGSATGGMLRYGAGMLLLHICSRPWLPWSTLAVNWFSCLLVGLVWAFSERMLPLQAELRLLLVVGFCGGLSSLSGYSLECIALLKQGDAFPFTLYAAATLLGGLLLAWTGLMLGRGS